MSVLVPMPVKPGLSPALRTRMFENLHRLVGPQFDVRLDERLYERKYDDENFFARLARMRQSLIDRYLRLYHTDVLWIDADIIDYPPNIYNLLRATGDGVVAPLVLIEDTLQNYDTAGMRESFDFRSGESPPYFSQEGPVVNLQSVGGCVVVPAHVHVNHRFESQADFEPNWVTEWWSICQAALKMGYKVQCNQDIVVYHADLPEYGEDWH